MNVIKLLRILMFLFYIVGSVCFVNGWNVSGSYLFLLGSSVGLGLQVAQ